MTVAQRFFVLNLLAVAGVVIGSNIGTALFLEQFGAKYLPHAFVLVAAVAIAAERVLRNLDRRVEPVKLMRLTCAFLLAAIALAWFGALARSRAAAVFLYVLPELAAFAVFSQVWNFASRHFDFSESKKRFPMIAAGGSLGGALGGAAVTLISGVAASTHALGLWCLALLAIPVLVAAIERGGTAVEAWRPADESGETVEHGRFLRRLQLRVHSFFAQTFLLVLCVFVVLGAVMTQLLDFQSQAVFARAFPSSQELAHFLGLFTSLSFIAGLLLQTLILSPLVSRIGAGNATFIFPLCTAGAGLWLARWPGLTAGTAGAFTRRYLKGSFFTVLVDLLLNALHPKERSRMRSILKGPVAAATTIVASLVILAVQGAGATGVIATLTVFLGLVFVGVAFILRRKYVSCLIEQIAKGRSGLAESASFAHGILEVDIEPGIYIATLEKADDDVAMLLMAEYRDKFPDSVLEMLPELHARSSGRVRGAIVRTLYARRRAKDRPWLERHLRSDDADSVAALFMEHGEFMEPMISEHALATVNDERAAGALKRAALFHLCLSPNQYYAYKGHLKLKETISSGERDELLWALEIVRNLEDRKLLMEFEPFLREPSVIDEWLDVLDRLEDGRDEIFAPILLRIFRAETGSTGAHALGRRRAALKILERIPAQETFDTLWRLFPDLESEDQAIILRIGTRWACMGPGELAPLMTSAALSTELFLMCCRSWKNLEATRTRDLYQARITAGLARVLDRARKDYAVLEVAAADETCRLPALVLRERMLRLADNSLAWKALVNMPLDDFEPVYQGLASSEKGMADRAVETIENTGGVAEAEVVRDLRALLISLRTPGPPPAVSAPVGAPALRDVLVRLAADRDSWLAAVALSSLARQERGFRVTRAEMARRLRPAALRDPFVSEALALLPAA